MTAAARRPVAFDPTAHDVTAFTSGEAALDVWLQRFAGQNQRRDAARTFVVTGDTPTVIGYYSLVGGHLDHGHSTAEVRRGLSKHFPIPIALLARLAVDQREHGCGIGSSMLLDALDRVVLASEHVATRAIVVDALSARAAAFYRHHGFRPLADDPLTLMVRLGEVRDALETRRGDH
jgi:GNAT superfamily N-acetyltransferase